MSVPNVVEGVVKVVGEFQDFSPEVQGALKEVGKVVDDVARKALNAAPMPVKAGVTTGATIGFALAGPIGGFMGAGMGAVAGLIWSAANGYFDK